MYRPRMHLNGPPHEPLSVLHGMWLTDVAPIYHTRSDTTFAFICPIANEDGFAANASDTNRILGEMLHDGLALQVAVLQMIFRHAHCSSIASAKLTAARPEIAARKIPRPGRKRVGGPRRRHLTAYEVS